MVDDRMKEILELTLAIQNKNVHYESKPVPEAHLASPVTEFDLSQLKRHLARLETDIPPSFIHFLTISDGIDDYMQLQSLSLRSAKEIIESQQSDCQWDDFAPLHEFVMASGDTGAFIAFDRSRVDPSGEMPVVWIDESGNRTEFSDFYKFLQEQLKFQKDVLAMNEADRANLQEV